MVSSRASAILVINYLVAFGCVYQAYSCVGKKIKSIEVVPICQMLRLVFESDTMIELSSCWRYRSSKSILKGALDIGFFASLTESKEQLNEFEAEMLEAEHAHLKQLNTLVGRKLQKIEFNDGFVVLELSGKRLIEWFCLSSENLGFRALDT
ncbi:hypothetical protein [Flocculibacter collagenilyticus]|uniref:hypothetical protein n=1 Tax=Flocculibacter collagenilyticus TaxID=2744479 RepID=UPI0018F7975A|nr:hypothetical protein [Flocculibacter collagenilyticus]